MPPRKYSRNSYCAGFRDSEGSRYLTDRERYLFRHLADTRLHVVQDGDDLFRLAGRYFSPLPRACGLWWIIADFQPQPIHDPTLALAPGTVLQIPSIRTVVEDIFNGRRIREAYQ